MKTVYSVILLFAMIFAGCSGEKTVKPTGSSVLSTKAVDAIYIVKAAYMGKHSDILQEYLEPQLAEKTLENLVFKQVYLSFVPSIVTIRESSIKTMVDWQGIWLFTAQQSVEISGTADFIQDRESMKILRIDGDNPFPAFPAFAEQIHHTIQPLPATPSDTDVVIEDTQPAPTLIQPEAAPESSELIKRDVIVQEPEGAEQKQATPETSIKAYAPYLVQVGAWKNSSYAYELLKKIKKHYPDAYIYANSGFRKIRIPGIASKKEGALLLKELKEKYHVDPLLVRTIK